MGTFPEQQIRLSSIFLSPSGDSDIGTMQQFLVLVAHKTQY